MIAFRVDYSIAQEEKDYLIVSEKIRSLFHAYLEYSNAVAVKVKSMLEHRYEIPEISIGEVWTLVEGVHKPNRNVMEVFATAVDPYLQGDSYLQYNDKDKSEEERQEYAEKIRKGKFEMYCIVKIASDSWDDYEIGEKLSQEISFIVSQAAHECGMPKKKFKMILTV